MSTGLAVVLVSLWTGAVSSASPQTQVRVDGSWAGTLNCGQYSGTADNPEPFIAKLVLQIDHGIITGGRTNDRVRESFSGSVDQNGNVTIRGEGQRPNNARQFWSYRAQGKITGLRLAAKGALENVNPITAEVKRGRDCTFELSNSTEAAAIAENERVADDRAAASAREAQAAQVNADAERTAADKRVEQAASVTHRAQDAAAVAQARDRRVELAKLHSDTARVKANAAANLAEKRAVQVNEAVMSPKDKKAEPSDAQKVAKEAAAADIQAAEKARASAAADRAAAELDAAKAAADRATAEKSLAEIASANARNAKVVAEKAKKESVRAKSPMDL